MKSHPDPTSGLPLVVQVAFAGKRRLLEASAAAKTDVASFHATVEKLLTARLSRLPSDLGLTARHKMCGLSSLAIGGDTFFTRACQSLNWWQRVFLPQPREDFLGAQGGSGADFTAEEADEARRLLASDHIIEERVVSLSADRHARFEDVNLELVRVCDVLVCLLPAEATEDKSGGTAEALNLAQRWRRPVLELRVAVDDKGTPLFTECWHWPLPRETHAD